MKRFILTLTAIFICTIAYAHTINWHVGNTILQTATCDSGESITPPTAPTKYGYTFNGWIGYTPIEYLESTGTQYIDTGVFLDKNYVKVELKDLVYSKLPYSTCYVFCGATNLVSTPTLSNSIHNCANMIQGNMGDTTNKNFFANNSSLETKYDISYEYSDNYYIVYLNEFRVEGRYTGSVQNTSASIYLYAFHELGKTTWISKIRLGGCKIYTDENTLVRDFIPVLDKDGVPCMFDKVEKKFYYNAGTGQFIAGPVITD